MNNDDEFFSIFAIFSQNFIFPEPIINSQTILNVTYFAIINAYYK